MGGGQLDNRKVMLQQGAHLFSPVGRELVNNRRGVNGKKNAFFADWLLNFLSLSAAVETELDQITSFASIGGLKNCVAPLVGNIMIPPPGVE